ncbi:MAG TPA: ribulose-phosphate 3-epimerase [Longilinea sp.]|nr:ribulose-phosphate 3-epimerase [Longilinea sp.]
MPTERFLLSASILSADFGHLEDQIRQIEQCDVDWLHIDVMDGVFVPNISMGPFVVETIHSLTKLPLDVHLMIINPERHVEAFAKAGAQSISIHWENNNNVHRTLQTIRGLGCKAGIVINPGTPVACIEALIDQVDLILVMSVNPGFSGQQFIPQSTAKVQQVRNLLTASSSKAVIQVDGGINETTAKDVLHAGADVLVAANAIFRYPQGIQAGVAALRKSAL